MSNRNRHPLELPTYFLLIHNHGMGLHSCQHFGTTTALYLHKHRFIESYKFLPAIYIHTGVSILPTTAPANAIIHLRDLQL